MNSYTTTDFLRTVRQKGNIPPANVQFGDSDLLGIADDELSTALLRQIVSARENFYLTYDVLPVNAANLYDIPSRAIGAALFGVINVNGDHENGLNRSDLKSAGSFSIMGNHVQVNPPLDGTSIGLLHLRRPNKMVAVSKASQIAAIDTEAGTMTFDSLPATFIEGVLYDCIQDQPHFNWRFIDCTALSVAGNVVTFASLPTTVLVGDWLALSGQTPVPQIPVEFIPLLAQRTVVKYYEIQGIRDKSVLAEKKLVDMERDVFQLINPRVANSPKRILPNPAHQGGRYWKGWAT